MGVGVASKKKNELAILVINTVSRKMLSALQGAALLDAPQGVAVPSTNPKVGSNAVIQSSATLLFF